MTGSSSFSKEVEDAFFPSSAVSVAAAAEEEEEEVVVGSTLLRLFPIVGLTFSCHDKEDLYERPLLMMKKEICDGSFFCSH
jgi:hypothetical protein